MPAMHVWGSNVETSPSADHTGMHFVQNTYHVFKSDLTSVADGGGLKHTSQWLWFGYTVLCLLPFWFWFFIISAQGAMVMLIGVQHVIWIRLFDI